MKNTDQEPRHEKQDPRLKRALLYQLSYAPTPSQGNTPIPADVSAENHNISKQAMPSHGILPVALAAPHRQKHIIDSLGRRVYGPYLATASSKRPGKSKIRRHVILTFGPNFSQRKNTSYARWLMEHSLGRELTPTETVDHDDENPLNDSLDNFNILRKKTMPEQIYIFANDKKWEPNRGVVERLLKRMAAKGLRSDWKFCHANKFRELLFSSGEVEGSGIVARKMRFNKWTFFTESGEEL